MINSNEIEAAIAELPKVELHLHLDCSLSYELVSRLVGGISRVEFEREFVAPSPCANLAEFLTYAPRGFRLMQTAEALRLATEDVFQQLASDNVIYAELRFAPLLHLERGLSAHEVVAIVERATADLIRQTGIEARLILCTLRHFTEEQSLLTAELVERFRGSHVVALDIAGDEAALPLDAHVSAFRLAAERGIHRTAHAGEAAGPHSIWQTISRLQPERIGHGVRCVEDAQLVNYLKANQFHLELCPTSNIQTQAWHLYDDHPIDTLLREGLAISVNTDTRTITNISLNSEYWKLKQHFGWYTAEFMRCNRLALEAAFIEPVVREQLLKRLYADRV